MKRICLLTTSFPRFADDEAGIFLQRLIEGYSSHGAHGVVVVPRDQDEEKLSTCKNFLVRRFGYGIFRRGSLAFGAGIMPNLRRRPSLVLQVPGLLMQLTVQTIRHRKDYDVVHANWALALLAAWVNSLLTGAPYIVTLRGEDIPLLRKPMINMLCRAAIKKASRVVSVNQQFLTDIQEIAGISPERCVLIPNGVSLAPVSPADAESLLKARGLQSGKYLLFVGTVVPRKRVDALIHAMTSASVAQMKLVVCGRLDEVSYVEKLRRLAADLGVSDRVQFEGAVSPSRIPLYLHGAAAYVSASAFEGRPNAVLEALAAGKTAVVSSIPAHAEIIRHGENGFLFEAENPATLGAIFASLRQSAEQVQAIESAARESVKNLSWKACAEQYLNIINIL